MKLLSLDIHNVRNIRKANLSFSNGLNLIQGVNGAGKSSILEAVYHLSTGHSFRTRQSKNIIHYGEDSLSVRGELSSFSTLAIQKFYTKSSVVKINTDLVPSASQLARFLPMQIIYDGLFDTLNSGSTFRRKFIDWGLFHVEPSFYQVSYSYKKAVAQKNKLLKIKTFDLHAFSAWDNAMVDFGILLHKYRSKYFNQLLPEFEKIIQVLCPNINIVIKYFHGWGQSLASIDKEVLLDELQKGRERDIQLGYCSKGAHRSDLRFHIDGHLAKEVLSRGQQKIILIALMLAQGRLLSEDCLYLIDDLSAELDTKTIKAICLFLKESKSQVILTSLDTTGLILEDFIDTNYHIQNGNLLNSN